MSRYEQEHAVYVLFANPTIGSRTGHSAIAVTQGDKIIRYLSLYHGVTPDDVRKIPASQRLKSIVGCAVDSYHADIVMRGQSHARTERSEKENMSVPELIRTLPTDELRVADYFARGQYHYALKVPNNRINAFKVIEALDEITAARYIPWAMVAPLGKIYDSRSHNCCSAIRHALNVGTGAARREIPMMLTKAFFTVAALTFYGMRSSDEPASTLFYLPMLYFVTQLMRAIYNAHLYVTDLKAMAKKESADLATLIQVYALCMIVNALGSPFSNNTCLALFVFPGVLAKSISVIPGVQKLSELPTIFTRVPKIQCEKATAHAALAA